MNTRSRAGEATSLDSMCCEPIPGSNRPRRANFVNCATTSTRGIAYRVTSGGKVRNRPYIGEYRGCELADGGSRPAASTAKNVGPAVEVLSVSRSRAASRTLHRSKVSFRLFANEYLGLLWTLPCRRRIRGVPARGGRRGGHRGAARPGKSTGGCSFRSQWLGPLIGLGSWKHR